MVWGMQHPVAIHHLPQGFEYGTGIMDQDDLATKVETSMRETALHVFQFLGIVI